MTLSDDLHITAPFVEELQQHERNQEEVRHLLSFDDIILGYCITAIEGLDERLRNNEEIKLTSAYHLPTATLNALRNIREHGSLRIRYENMYNQCLVLSVSYFVSGFEALFVQGVSQACCCCPDLLVATKEDLKFSISELRACDFQLGEHLGKMIVQKKDINFQNMQAGLKAFKDFLGVDGFSDPLVHDVILALAGRHIIVHNLARVDDRFLALVKHAPARTVHVEAYQVGDQIQFTPDEVTRLQESMSHLLEEVATAMNEKILATANTTSKAPAAECP
ncbi:MAG: hypothetical protein IPM12_06390 [Flavobacteriales bacterium]|nr:hypothetical protein [Flavobacteriales bacterium]